MTDREQYRISKDEALKRLAVKPDYDAGDGPEPCVHTFRQLGPALMGAHMSLVAVEAAIDRYGVEETGPDAMAMNHGLAYIDERGPMFLETKAVSDEAEVADGPQAQ